MAIQYPPRRESLLVPWSDTFGTILTGAPVIHGVTAAQCTTYTTIQTSFYDAWLLCQAAETKSKGNVSLKNAAKTALISEIRLLGRLVQACPTVTNPMRVALGLPERGLGPTPVPTPLFVPQVEVKDVYGTNITLLLSDPTDARRALAKGCQGIQLFSAIGAAPPPPGEGWKAEGVVKRRKIIVQFPVDTPPGTKVWFTALYYNPRGITGMASTPIWSNIGFEGAVPMPG